MTPDITPAIDAYYREAARAARAAIVRGYAIRSYRDGGESFACVLTLRGEQIASVSNAGCGGCHRYGWASREARLAAEALAQRLLPDMHEPLDTLISAMIDHL